MSKVFTITDGLENMGALRTGGQGSVYKGRRTGIIYTAVKLLPTPIHTESEDDKNFRNFQNEVAKLQKVNQEPNPNVVKILSSGITESGSFPFIEMEYIEGPDLCELLQPPHEKVFMLKEVIKVADQLAGALAHCHKVGVKHGDIKSNNVKYNIHTGNYVLLDFGLAIMTDEQRRSSIRYAGAIEFMAPEQHEGRMLPQTDVYGYGIILYELLAGEVPFPLKGNGDAGRNAVMLAHMEAPVPDLLLTRTGNLPESWPAEKQKQEIRVPAWLLSIVSLCLEKDPEKRFASGVELHEAILKGSISADDTQSGKQLNAYSTSALQSENERLQALLWQYQKSDAVPAPAVASPEDDDDSKVALSKPLFGLFVVLLVLFMGFSVYSAFFKAQKPYKAGTDSLQVGQPDTAKPYQAPDMDQATRDAQEEAIRRQRRKDSLAELRRQQILLQASPDSNQTTEPDTSRSPD